MHRIFSCLLVGVCVLLTAGMALAADQDYNFGYPLQGDSDVVTIDLPPIHIEPGSPPPPVAGWAGAVITLHNLDNQEVDVDRVFGNPFIFSGGEVSPLGPRSGNLQSEVGYVKLLQGAFVESGIDVTPSMFIPTAYLAGVDLHIKGTNVGQNSDTDLVIGVYNIWHARQDSVVWDLQNSDLVWGGALPPQHTAGSQSFIPQPVPPIQGSSGPGGGNWYHLTGLASGQFQPVHFFASDYFATLVTLYTVGIEHVPEPAAAVLMATGIGCAVAGRWFRKRRKAVSE